MYKLTNVLDAELIRGFIIVSVVYKFFCLVLVARQIKKE